MALFDALHDAPDIRRITTRHEQGAAFMADGYARASGEIGVCLTATGPGALNTLAVMGTAFTDSSPVLNIFTQIVSAHIGQVKGHLHEVRDQLSMFSEVTGWRARAENVGEIPGLLRDAMSHMRLGKPRPAAFEVPRDVLDATHDAEILSPVVNDPEPPSADQIRATKLALLKARRLVIWAGGGVIPSGASAVLVQLADVLHSLMITTVSGKGSIPENHPLSLGATALQPRVPEYLAGCDLILAIGTGFDAQGTADWSLDLPPNSRASRR